MCVNLILNRVIDTLFFVSLLPKRFWWYNFWITSRFYNYLRMIGEIAVGGTIALKSVVFGVEPHISPAFLIAFHPNNQ